MLYFKYPFMNANDLLKHNSKYFDFVLIEMFKNVCLPFILIQTRRGRGRHYWGHLFQRESPSLISVIVSLANFTVIVTINYMAALSSLPPQVVSQRLYLPPFDQSVHVRDSQRIRYSAILPRFVNCRPSRLS